MSKILAATLIIIGTIFVSAYAVCMAIFQTVISTNTTTSEYIFLLIGGIIAMVAGMVLVFLEYKKK